MDLVNTLIERYFGVSDGELLIGGIPVTSLAAEYGTPLYVYDRGIIDKKLALLRDTLPPEFAIHYSVKANPNSAVIKHLVDAGCGLEIASSGEFCRALDAGCPAEKILFAGPGKTERELEFALEKGIWEIHIESLLEAQRISSICRRVGVRGRAAIRVNPSSEAQGGAMRMGGKPAPFGVDEEILDDVLDYLLENPAIDFRGIHLFTGTQILDHTLLVNQYKRGLAIARRVAARLQKRLHTVDFGGGLGIPYFGAEREMDMGQLRERLAEVMTRVRQEACFAGTRFIVEPGRYLVGDAGIYVARINDIKISRGRKFLILDGGMNHHLAASGNLGQVIKRNFPVTVINKLDQREKDKVDIVGPLCTPLDTLARDVEVPIVSIGDLVGIFQSGAYALSASPIGFLSHPIPAEVVVYRDAATAESSHELCSAPFYDSLFRSQDRFSLSFRSGRL
jgi:diaminopimelate decarboxylase